MKYFTPELFIALNSEDDAVAAAAEEQWQIATDDYRDHLRRIEAKLPETLRRFAADVCPHDAEIVASMSGLHSALPYLTMQLHAAGSRRSYSVLSVNHEGAMMTLLYSNVEPPEVQLPAASDVFYDDHLIWLYDEISCPKRGRFCHEILFSNGRVAKFVFDDFVLAEYPALEAVAVPATG